MTYNGEEIEFPAVLQLSFAKLIDQLEAQANGQDKGLAAYAKSLLVEVEKYPELRDGISDFTTLDKYKPAIRRLTKPLFPENLSTNEIKTLSPMFYPEPLVTSQRFDNIIKASGQPFEFTMKGVDADTLYLYCCYFILATYYNYIVPTSSLQLLEIFNKNQGIMRTYKVLVNADMSEFTPTEKAVPITLEDYKELMNNFGDMELWKSKFPPNSWLMKGVSITNFVDVTIDQSVNAITSNLLVKSTDSFDKIRAGIRNYLNNPTLAIGVLNMSNGHFSDMGKEAVKSVLLQDGSLLNCKEDMCDYSYELLVQKKEPFIVTDVDYFHERANNGFSKRMKETGYKSYMIIPIIHEGEFLAYMELGAKETYALHNGTMLVLDQIIPIIAIAQKRFMTEAQNRIEAIIQQECTTIHPSVKWRFEEEAKKFMDKQMQGQQPVFTDIIFNNLYPMYGQMDIKGSSERRNKAVSADLTKQLNEVNKVLKAAFEQTNIQLFEELRYKANKYKKELAGGLAASSEHTVMAFLKSDVYPAFEHLEAINPAMKEMIAAYRSILNPNMQTVYEERKKYDESVNQINQRLASYLDKKQVEAQEIFPHYFERYKTDGVEYNIYIGDSISRDRQFSSIYLKNLRLWQLLVMCEMENEFRKMQGELGTSIEIASLILVYNTSISVHFRMDEKQFDVEGAYNARYEIIKKRVDKAHIKGTDERITRPGSIVIVYAQEQDAYEYRSYLEYLIFKGYLKEGFEDVELEDLQGVHGLRALRAEVAYQGLALGLQKEEVMEGKQRVGA